MILVITFLWVCGFIISNVLCFILRDEDNSVLYTVLLALLWPLVAVVILYLMFKPYFNKKDV